MKSIIEVVKANKGAIVKKALVVGGIVAGLVIGAKALTSKDEELEKEGQAILDAFSNEDGDSEENQQ
jgi:hypothetical protein